MDPKSAGQVIRDTVTMEQILDFYGYQTRHGFMVCPFHGDHDASLKVYKGDKGWHCFGCGKGGSVIDFVMEHEGCNYKTAVAAIDNALGLRLNDPNEDAMKADRKREIQRSLDAFAEACYAYIEAQKIQIECTIRQDLARLKELEVLRQMEPPALTAADYDFMLQWKDISEYNEYRLEKLDDLREEVAAWRRKARRVF